MKELKQIILLSDLIFEEEEQQEQYMPFWDLQTKTKPKDGDEEAA